MAHIVAPISGVLAVIIIYQCLGVKPYWAALWLVVWVVPFALVFLFPKSVPNERRRPQIWIERVFGGISVPFLVLYFVLHCGVTVAAFAFFVRSAS